MPVQFAFEDMVLCIGTEKGAVRMWAAEKTPTGRYKFTYITKCQHRSELYERPPSMRFTNKYKMQGLLIPMRTKTQLELFVYVLHSLSEFCGFSKPHKWSLTEGEGSTRLTIYSAGGARGHKNTICVFSAEAAVAKAF
jgi:hypothetical protein